MSAKVSYKVPRTPRNSSTQISPKLSSKQDEIERDNDIISDEIREKIKISNYKEYM